MFGTMSSFPLPNTNVIHQDIYIYISRHIYVNIVQLYNSNHNKKNIYMYETYFISLFIQT